MASARSVDSLLLVVPPGPGAPARVSPDTMVAGLPLLKRIVLAGTRAGFSEVRLPNAQAGVGPLLDGPAVATLTPDDPPGPSSRRRIVILPGNVVPQPRWLRALLEMELRAETLYVDSSSTAVIETDEPAIVIAVAAHCGSAEELAGALRGRFGGAALDSDATGRFPLAAAADVPLAETWLLRSLIKQREGFMSRHVERRISLALTRRLVTTRVTPDAMTLVSVAIGLLGAPFFLSSSPAWQLTGALLFLAHSILDGCDGELARLKFMESRRGAVLDFWGDNVVHVAVFGGMAIGWSLAVGATWPLFLGALTVVSTLGSAACMLRPTMRDTAPDGSASWTARLADAFAHRDFIYLVVLLSAFGKAGWFLILASVGTPIFFALLLWVGAMRRAG